MNSEIKQCQNCKQNFTIEPDDFSFYERMQVPAPTFCPQCRFQRRLSFCNERHLYKNNCSLCGKGMIAMYPPGTKFPVYCLSCYRSDNWDPLSYGREYNFNQPFFEQFKELKSHVPRASLVRQGDIAGSEYCNRASYNKDCYLLIRANYNENSLYSYNLWESRDSADCFNVHKSELVYNCIDSIDCYHAQYCRECGLCRDSILLFDCRNCTSCAGCVGLRNKQYYILNHPYTKEEYENELRGLNLDTVAGLSAFETRFREILDKSIRESEIETNCVRSSGNWLTDCKDVLDSYQCREVENGKYLLSVIGAKDCMDYSYWGRETELVYEASNCGYNASRIRFSNESWDACHDLTYCDNCYSSGNLFGSVGLRKKDYCILNRQYTKEEYEKMLPRITEHMSAMPYTDKRGRVYKFGEFFPTELSASPYNMTAAYENFPLNKEEILKEGYAWEDFKEKEYAVTKSWRDLPEDIKSVDDGILKEVILCKTQDEGGKNVIEERSCTKAFRIIPEELSFYRRMNIPLPRSCFNCRHYERFKKRNPLKLWHRKCMCDKPGHSHISHCPNEFETSYAPERKEIVYCEQCYNAEVV
ncbi:hypothetical protein D4R51_02495 [bacterium]|nr:MAG: hypothetical protein D4R51_02495 [bacterium]